MTVTLPAQAQQSTRAEGSLPTALAAAPVSQPSETTSRLPVADSAWRPQRVRASILDLPWGPIKNRRQAVLFTSVGTAALVANAMWYSKGVSGHFLVSDEGWFEEDTYAGGSEKLGHAISCYAGTRLLARALVWSGTEPEASLRLSLAVNLATGLAVEVCDGLARTPYGFSKEDLLCDALGAGFGYLMEKYPRMDELFAFRLMIRPAGDQKYNPFDNHDWQTYLLSLKLAGITPMSRSNPLRYLELAVGYRAQGYRAEYNGGPDPGHHRRTVYFGVMLNVNEVLRSTVFARQKVPPLLRRSVETAFDFVQVPGTLLAHERNL